MGLAVTEGKKRKIGHIYGCLHVMMQHQHIFIRFSVPLLPTPPLTRRKRATLFLLNDQLFGRYFARIVWDSLRNIFEMWVLRYLKKGRKKNGKKKD